MQLKSIRFFSGGICRKSLLKVGVLIHIEDFIETGAVKLMTLALRNSIKIKLLDMRKVPEYRSLF
jgi:hypothetical protein